MLTHHVWIGKVTRRDQFSNWNWQKNLFISFIYYDFWGASVGLFGCFLQYQQNKLASCKIYLDCGEAQKLGNVPLLQEGLITLLVMHRTAVSRNSKNSHLYFSYISKPRWQRNISQQWAHFQSFGPLEAIICHPNKLPVKEFGPKIFFINFFE